MFRFLKNIMTRPVAQTIARTNSTAKPKLETLEVREMPALIIAISTTSIDNIGFPLSNNSMSSAFAVNLPVMTHESVSKSLSSSADDSYYEVTLQQGDFVAASVAVTGTGQLNDTLYALNSAGTEIAASATKTVPITVKSLLGTLTHDETIQPSIGFYAPQTGTYYLEMSSAATTSTASRGWDLNLERVELYDTAPTAQLAEGGSFHAWLNQTGNTLNIAGPTGYGFSLEGKWNEVVSGSKITYSTTGGLELETPALSASVGSIAMRVPKGQTFSVTASNAGQPQLGILTGVSGDLGLSLSPIAGIIESEFGINVSDESVLNNWTIETGTQVMQNYLNGAGQHLDQMLDGIPYLVYGNKASLDLGFAGITVSANQSSLIMVADPADPFLYVQDGNYAVAGSVNARIPFDTDVPVQTNTVKVDGISLTHTFNPNANYGQIFASGAFPLSGVPITVAGSVTVNLDANDDGKLLEGAGTASQLFQGDFKGVENVLSDIDVGVNGSASIGYSIAGVSIHVPIGSASVVYDGSQQAVFFTGTQGSAVWEGTALADFNVGPGAQIEGYIYSDGQFSVSTTGNFMVSAVNAALTITVTNESISASGKLIVNNPFSTTPLATAEVSGTIGFNGIFTWSGEANVNIGNSKNGIEGEAGFVFTNADSEVTFDLDLNCSAQAEVGTKIFGTEVGVTAQGKISGDLDLVWNNQGQLTFDYATLDIAGSYSVLGVGGSFNVEATLNGNELSFDVDGYNFGIAL
jgi:hypothetical protein